MAIPGPDEVGYMHKLGGVIYVEFDDPQLSYSYPEPNYRELSLDVSLSGVKRYPPSTHQMRSHFSFELESQIQHQRFPVALQVEVPIPELVVVAAAPELQVEVPISAVTLTPNDSEITVEYALESMYSRKQRKRAQIRSVVKNRINANRLICVL